MAASQNTVFAAPQVNMAVLTKLSVLDETNASGWVKKYPNLVRGNYFLGNIDQPGFMVYTGRRDFKTYVDENRPLPNFTVLTGATGTGPGDPVEIQIDPASHLGNDLSLSALVVGDIWESSLNGIQVEILEINKAADGAHTVALNPTKSSVTLDLEDGEEFRYFGRISAEEASSEMAGIYRDWTEAIGYTDIIRTDQEYSDYALFTQVGVQGAAPGGATFYELNRPNLDMDHIAKREQKHLFGSDMDNLKAHSNQEGRAKGAIQYAKESYGTIVPPTGGSVVDDEFIKVLADRALSDGESNVYDILSGNQFLFAFQDAIAAANLGSNAQVIVADGSDGNGIDINRNYTSYSAYGIRFNAPEAFNWFDVRRTHGLNNNISYLTRSALFIPQSTVTLPDGTQRRRMSIRYMGRGEGGPFVHMNQAGGLFTPMSSVERVGKLALTSYEGLEMFGQTGFMFAHIPAEG